MFAGVQAMSRVNFTAARHVGYFILMEPRADGPVVGYYAGHPIAAAVVDYFGRRFAYAGVAPRLPSGRYDVEALLPGEWIVEPGLIYCGDPSESGDLPKRHPGSDHHSVVGAG
jgi:hypothetical protein